MVAALLGFGGLDVASAGTARVLCLVFLGLSLLSALGAVSRRRRLAEADAAEPDRETIDALERGVMRAVSAAGPDRVLPETQSGPAPSADPPEGSQDHPPSAVLTHDRPRMSSHGPKG